ncbi:unnamed protein product [Dibothriocephalus latus]|uniref:Uncharacterized protein n=1 Tax=Dibothriocephalus latus TaxID=60516 RepID=A0A3P7LMH6_DIBLA|nr:unnamed protein product [Dibothriocephalus latus]
MTERRSSSSLLGSRSVASPTNDAFWPPVSEDCGVAPQTVPELLTLGVGGVHLGGGQRSSLELASRDTASLASEEVAAVNISAESGQYGSSPVQVRCPTTPDDSSLQVEDDAPLCSSVSFLVLFQFIW